MSSLNECIMKKHIISGLIIIIVLNFNKTYSQKNNFLKITYVKDYYNRLDTAKVKSDRGKISNLNKIILKNSKGITYQLIVSNHHSAFKMDKLKISKSNNDFKELAGSLGGTKGIFYINKKDSIYINKKHFAGEEFIIKLKPRKWKITNKTKRINNFNCYKALSQDVVSNHKGVFKFNVVAWFCPDLPSFFGPAKYYGLPGLILELDNGKTRLLATRIDFLKTKNSNLTQPKNGIKLTEEEFEGFVKDKAKKMFKNSFQRN